MLKVCMIPADISAVNACQRRAKQVPEMPNVRIVGPDLGLEIQDILFLELSSELQRVPVSPLTASTTFCVL